MLDAHESNAKRDRKHKHAEHKCGPFFFFFFCCFSCYFCIYLINYEVVFSNISSQMLKYNPHVM